MAKVTPITEQFQHFVSELKESFWGDLHGQVQQSMRSSFSSAVGAAARPVHGRVRAIAGRSRGAIIATAITSAILLPASETLRLRIARTRKRRLSAGGAGEVSAPGSGGVAADPRGLPARHLDPAGGAGGGHADRRSGQSADGVAADPRPGRGGAAVSSSAACRTTGRTCSWTG